MRLGSYLASTDVKISKIFSSDLQRAFKTGEYIRLAQSVPLPETTKLKLLREQDFGSFEGKAYSERPRASDKQGQDTILENLRSDPDFKDVEPKKSMILRMKTFIDSYLTESFERGADEDAVAVIAHGVILSFLWRGITERFEGRNIVLAPNVMVADRGMGLKYLGGWANTGYMELEIQKRPVNAQEPSPASGPQPSQPAITHNHVPEQQDSEVATELASPTTLNGEISLPSEAAAVSPTQQTRPGFKDLLLVVKTVNCRDHLRDLKKARGGIGSLQHDEKQTTMDSFIKRRKVE
jgi:broad specificity phosphatase PhoE